MDLHSGQPPWLADAQPLTLAPVAGDEQCEVAVIGGGITGVLVGYFLVREGVRVMLFDRRQPAAGSTAASTGLLQYETDTHLNELIRKVGRQRAEHAYRRGIAAIAELEALAGLIPGGCGFSRRDSLYFATTADDAAELETEFAARRAAGLPVRILDRQQLAERSSIRAAAALLSSGDGQIDPFAFTRGILDRAMQAGMQAFGESQLVNCKDDGDGLSLTFPQAIVRARAVVNATGYEAREQLRDLRANLNSTYAVGSAPLPSFPGWPDGCLVWETARPYFYARQTDDGRALIGGADTEYHDDHEQSAQLKRQAARLIERCGELFPELSFRPEYVWAGVFAETKDGLAYIGRPPGRPHEYFALGYGGNGITFGAIAARLIADLYLRRPNADAEVFAFER